MDTLGQPNLYIADNRMQGTKSATRPVLAGLKLSWGTDARFDTAPPATLSGELLVRGAIPSYLNVGASVGLMDPARSRCLFAGTMEPLTARPDPSVAGAMRVSFTATSPSAELGRHTVTDMDWPHEETAASRRGRLARSLPAGWTLDGVAGWDWINQGRQKYQSVDWMELAERYVRSYLQRLHDTSYYLPGSGMSKRLTISGERAKTLDLPADGPGRWGTWRGLPSSGATGVAALPVSAVATDMSWEKTPEDVITDVQLTSTGGAFPTDESTEFEYMMTSHGINNSWLQRTYGMRQLRLPTALSSFSREALTAAMVDHLVPYWLDTQTSWRPTSLVIPDSRQLDIAPLLNLLAVDSRHLAVVTVPDMPQPAPGPVRSYVMAGNATWTGKKWTTELTLGRTL